MRAGAGRLRGLRCIHTLVDDQGLSRDDLTDLALLRLDAMVVIATGVRPNSYLARRAGLEVNKGVVVDNHLVSSDPNVLAAGDVAEHHGNVYGAWGASQFQGNIAGRNAAGATAEFGGIPRSHILKVRTRSTTTLERLLSTIQSWPGVHGTSTSIVLSTFKDSRAVRAVPTLLEPFQEEPA